MRVSDPDVLAMWDSMEREMIFNPEVVSALDALAKLIEADIPLYHKARAIDAIHKATDDWLVEFAESESAAANTES